MFSIYTAFRETILTTRIKTMSRLLALLVSLCFRSRPMTCRVLQHHLILTPACFVVAEAEFSELKITIQQQQKKRMQQKIVLKAGSASHPPFRE